MKRLLVTLIFIFFANTIHAQSGYELIFNLKSSKDSIAFLTYYQFDKTYIKDTCFVAKNGQFIFKGKTKLETGIYSLVSQQKTIYFDFFVDDQNQNLEFKNDQEPNDIQGLNVLNSESQNTFIDYLKFVNKQNRNFNTIKDNLNLKTHKDTLFLLEKQKEIEQEIIKYEKDFYTKNKSVFIGDVINLKIEKVLEVVPQASNGRPDSLKVYNYYKKHYWDDVDFKADETMRNPFFYNKLKKYFDSVIIQNPDSVIVEVDRLLAKTVPGSNFKKILLAHFIQTFETSKIMGFDKIFVHLSDRYLKNGEGAGIYKDDLVVNSIIKRADILRPLLLGSIAPDLYMIKANDYPIIHQMGFNNIKDSNEVTQKYYSNVDQINKMFITLHSVEADHIILVFWDVDCGHCKTEIPKLKELYNDFLGENKKVKVFSVYTMHNAEKFVKYINENGLNNWINVYDGVYINNLVNKYDIYSTPVVYILDENKKIIAKRIGMEQIKDFIINTKR